MDDMFRQQYEQDSIGGLANNVDYGTYLNNMLQHADLPTSYTFYVQIYAETKDYDGDKNDMTILMSSTHDYLAMITDDKGKKSMILIDVAGDIMAMYVLK